jgi:hypothetical protein
MYLAVVLLTMLVLPVGAIGIDHGSAPGTPLMLLVGKWFVFWSAGLRLLLAGLRQFFQPRFTAHEIFGLEDDHALPLVRELGVANFATSVVAILSLAWPSFRLPVAIAAGIFFGIAGIRHALEPARSRNQIVAMVSDLFAAMVFAAYLGWVALG